ncbi:MAG: hypothetical protein Q8R33_13380 [Burkholderiales bacterium]|nr:hypothetical protein [Burkholderiales bacterium]
MKQDLKSQIGSSLHSVGAFFKRPLNLQNGAITLGLARSTLIEQARATERKHVRRMRADLFFMLEQHPASRELVRSLALVERTMQRSGFEGVDKLPQKLLARALAELERLVWDWSPVGLAELRSRLAVLVKNKPVESARESQDMLDGPASKVSVFAGLDSAQPADVSEVDHEVFEEMERSWVGQIPKAA